MKYQKQVDEIKVALVAAVASLAQKDFTKSSIFLHFQKTLAEQLALMTDLPNDTKDKCSDWFGWGVLESAAYVLQSSKWDPQTQKGGVVQRISRTQLARNFDALQHEVAKLPQPRSIASIFAPGQDAIGFNRMSEPVISYEVPGLGF